MNFIGEWFLDKLTICDELIEYFNNNSEQHKSSPVTSGYDPTIKKCTELVFQQNSTIPQVEKYLTSLKKVTDEYISSYPWCNEYSPWTIAEGFQIQYYKPSEAFYQFHTERISGEFPFSTRHLVFMTYLNDVTDGGETEFINQSLKIKPQKGKTLIWPADWTHTHRGIPSPTQEKYIVTGWFNYV